MKAATKLITLAITAIIATVSQPAQASDVEAYIRKLKGSVKSELTSASSAQNSSQSVNSTYQPRNGGILVQPGRPTPVSRPSGSVGKTRTMKFGSSASVPSSLRSAATQNKVAIRSGGDGSAHVSYHVDSSSKVSTDDILFRKGSTEFADRYSYGIVRDLAYAMKSPELRGFQFVIEGHASAEGSYSSNASLSQRRAERIVSEMIRLGVDPWQLVGVGYGESEANYPPHAPEHLLSQDRRVVVYRLNN